MGIWKSLHNLMQRIGNQLEVVVDVAAVVGAHGWQLVGQLGKSSHEQQERVTSGARLGRSGATSRAATGAR